jgi:hypothetical protein
MKFNLRMRGSQDLHAFGFHVGTNLVVHVRRLGEAADKEDILSVSVFACRRYMSFVTDLQCDCSVRASLPKLRLQKFLRSLERKRKDLFHIIAVEDNN